MSPECLCPWLFCQPVLKLKRLKMYMSYAVHVHTDIQVEQVEIAPITSHVHQCLEKLIVSNTALKQLELSVICAGLYGNILMVSSMHWTPASSCSAAWQGKALEELQIAGSWSCFDFKENIVKDFFIHVWDLSQDSGTTLVLLHCILFPEMCLPILSKEFQGKKIKRIIYEMWGYYDSLPSHFGLIADELIVRESSDQAFPIFH